MFNTNKDLEVHVFDSDSLETNWVTQSGFKE